MKFAGTARGIDGTSHRVENHTSWMLVQKCVNDRGLEQCVHAGQFTPGVAHCLTGAGPGGGTAGFGVAGGAGAGVV